MNNNIKYLFLATTLFFASCAKLAPSKDEVEAGFDAPVKLPTLSISDKVECDAMNGVATTTVTISGLPANTYGLTIGMLSSLTEDFASCKFVPMENISEGTVQMKASIMANRTYYLKAVAASPKGGSSYSEVVSVSVPDIPFWAKIAGTYAGTVVSEAYGDEYDNVLVVSLSEEDPEHYCYISGIEPYYYSNGCSLEENGLNWVMAEIDEESNCLIVEVGADLHLNGVSLYGWDAAYLDDVTAFAPITFALTDDGDLFQAGGFYSVDDEGAAEDAYAGNVTYFRQ